MITPGRCQRYTPGLENNPALSRRLPRRQASASLGGIPAPLVYFHRSVDYIFHLPQPQAQNFHQNASVPGTSVLNFPLRCRELVLAGEHGCGEDKFNLLLQANVECSLYLESFISPG